MTMILIWRFVRPDKEMSFRENYQMEKPHDNPAFLSETLTRLADLSLLPTALQSSEVGPEGCITYVNIAHWKSWTAFAQHFGLDSEDFDVESFDADFEIAPRRRLVLDEI
jgi:hypothetical protein